jgi:hypothetical protein
LSTFKAAPAKKFRAGYGGLFLTGKHATNRCHRAVCTEIKNPKKWHPMTFEAIDGGLINVPDQPDWNLVLDADQERATAGRYTTFIKLARSPDFSAIQAQPECEGTGKRSESRP